MLGVFSHFIFAAALASGLYPVPSPLPSAKPGTVIWSRAYTGASALGSAATNTLLLYHTVAATGRDVAVSGVLSIPKGTPPAGGWPIISWAHGTTGNAPQCAPSRASQPNGEQRFLNSWVAMGFAVVQTDYEGESTPGLHPYFVNVSGAHDTIDIVRAARAIDAGIGNRWIVMGHSEGGTVALFTASLAQAWAPELNLEGAVSYAPGSDITDALGRVMTSREPMRLLPLPMMMVEGIASADPAIDLHRILSPEGLAMLPALQTECVDALMNSPRWNAIPPASLFLPNADVDRLLHDFGANEPLNLHIGIPVLLAQGTNDSIVAPSLTEQLASNLCAAGDHVERVTVTGASHGSVMPETLARVRAFVSDRLGGKPLTGACTSVSFSP
jgi:pimeloyl-ACP methyl ester carboxylesterase